MFSPYGDGRSFFMGFVYSDSFKLERCLFNTLTLFRVRIKILGEFDKDEDGLRATVRIRFRIIEMIIWTIWLIAWIAIAIMYSRVDVKANERIVLFALLIVAMAVGYIPVLSIFKRLAFDAKSRLIRIFEGEEVE